MKKNCHVLAVDDNKSILTALKLLLSRQFAKITTISNPNQLPEKLRTEQIDIVLLDMNFKAGLNNGNEGLYWLQEIKKAKPDTVVIMMTAYGDVQLAVDALKLGAADFVVKPWENEKLLATLNSACELFFTKKEVMGLRKQQQILKNQINSAQKHIIGSSPAMQQVMRTIKKVASTEANILITGENGTGKELVAREIHQQSARCNEVMVAVDMGALSESLFESELFGHKKGAFTDAKDDRAGKFETANKGTLFLDEIGNLSLAMQAKLLVALQSRTVSRVGSDTPVPVDIRLICATNKKLEEETANEHFRQDLLYRINTIQIEIPPLRERGNDILMLAEFFITKYAAKYGKGKRSITEQAKQKLLDYPWPGNVRELQHAMEKAVILSDSQELGTDDFILQTKNQQVLISPSQTLDEMETTMIHAALLKHGGNMSATAQQLGITRQTLYNKMKKYRI